MAHRLLIGRRMATKTVLACVLAVGSLTAPAHAEDIYVSSFEYIDVVETVDGSVWKGAVIEHTPNVQYKITTADGSLHVIKAADVVRLTKQRNQNVRRAPMPAPAQPGAYGAAPGPAYGAGPGVSSSYSSSSGGLPAPYAKPGMRIDPDVGIVFPTVDLGHGDEGAKYKESFAPGVRVGHETFLGNFGFTVGGLARFTYWRMHDNAVDLGAAHWTLETHVFGRAALHVGRAAPYLGLSLGLDTNYLNNGDLGELVGMQTSTAVGFGVNAQAGVAVAASPGTAFDVGVDLHPGTDRVAPESDDTVSYFALRVGASIRL
ncbi:MAG: hypothetical protein AB7O24_27570 [Kofleriaceae bacterium]